MTVSTEVQHGAYITVPAVSVMLLSSGPVEYPTTAPDFLCMGYDEALHALLRGYAATMTPDVWGVLRKVVAPEVAG